MVSSEMEVDYYDPGDVGPKSPVLSATRVNLSPGPLLSPAGMWQASDMPFFWTDGTIEADLMDGLLLSYMGPNNPEVALIGMEDRLESESEDDSDEDTKPVKHIGNFSRRIINPWDCHPNTAKPKRKKGESWVTIRSMTGDDFQLQAFEPMKRKKYGLPSPRNRTTKARWGLPLTVETSTGPATVMACADTGSEENIISMDIASALGLPITRAEQGKQFVLANGRIVEAYGQVSALCSFGVETSPISLSMRCIFHVFLRLASPIIMGMSFLEETETMTNHRERLVKIARPNLQALQVYALGRPKQELLCFVESELTLATPDSGSDLDLMAPRYASERGFEVSHGEEKIEFADGSVAITSGSVFVEVAVNSTYTGSSSASVTKIPTVEFFLLENLAHDVLVGQDTLGELSIFEENQHSLVPGSNQTGPVGLNRIRLLGALDRIVTWVRNRISKKRGNSSSEGVTAEHTLTVRLDDQRENARREREVARIATLPLHEQDAAIELERRKQTEYESKQQVVSPLQQVPHPDPPQSSTTSTRSPGSAFPPLSASSLVPPPMFPTTDIFLRSGQSHVANLSPQRPLEAVDDSEYSHAATCGSPAASASTEGHNQPMSIDEALPNGILPPPNTPNGTYIQHIPPHGSGGFKCDHPGCTAAPFQTRYLLNSHANIHQEGRPHFFPVQGCSRAKGGRGFKRKNEMIRHGLVHTSPGYICPFCSDREHKYPRPDNLARHVRVHHADIPKDDIRLQEVLAQRPEAGSRGRRRRSRASTPVVPGTISLPLIQI